MPPTLEITACYAGSTHDAGGGQLWDTTSVAETLLDPAGAPRDGVTILGGEPAQQPEGVWAVIAALRLRDPALHLTLYSGYTIEELRTRPEPEVCRILDATDLLIDGRYVRALSDGAGEWRGSRNQRAIDLRATRLHGGILRQPD